MIFLCLHQNCLKLELHTYAVHPEAGSQITSSSIRHPNICAQCNFCPSPNTSIMYPSMKCVTIVSHPHLYLPLCVICNKSNFGFKNRLLFSQPHFIHGFSSIQDVSSGGSRISPRRGRLLSRGRQHTILLNFPKNCMKLKEFGPPGGGGGARPKFYYVDPPLVSTCQK